MNILLKLISKLIFHFLEPSVNKSNISKQKSQNVLQKINVAESPSNGFIYPLQRFVNYQQVQRSNSYENKVSFNLMQQKLKSNMGNLQVNAYQAPQMQVLPQAAIFNYQGSNANKDILYQTNAPGKRLCERQRGDLKPNTHTYREF